MTNQVTTRRIFVISDLHLGGRSSSEGGPGFQMFSPEGQARLAHFIRWAASQQTSERQVELVLNGDIVDFLAEEKLLGEPHAKDDPPFRAFTAEDDLAERKLSSIIDRTREVWSALQAFVAKGARLTFLLGNHDIELSLPGPRRLLHGLLGRDLRFFYDNEALVIGPVLIEHGNRYDSWNVVPHDTLRQVRSSLSRKEKPPRTPDVPGSELVVRVMNKIKAEHAFVDLLKPETSAVLPLLAVLVPGSLKELGPAWKCYKRARKVKFDAEGVPIDPANIGEIAASTPRSDEENHRLAYTLAGVDPAEIGVGSYLPVFRDLWGAIRAGKRNDREAQLDRLQKALQALGAEYKKAFDTQYELETYRVPARAALARGFRLVIYGHTHLVKRLDLSGGRYLNTGTWADLVRFPSEALTDRAALATLADEIADKTFEKRRVQLPTFARVDLGEDGACEGDVFLYREKQGETPIPDGVLPESMMLRRDG